MDIKKAREELRKGKTIYDMNLSVGYYARVSTDKDDQLNSLENQQKYFEEMISENKNWNLYRGYIDEGISGTAVNKRESFLQMIEDATMGRIDLILTKEISRFSRNTVDSIKYTEYLLKQGVIVYFLSDNLNTIQEDAEFRLTIMSSLAQDEVRKLSERVKFGINRMIKDGKLIGGNLTGYYKKNGKYEITANNFQFKGLEIARMLGFMQYLSLDTMQRKFGRNYVSNESLFDMSGRFEIERYLDYNGANFTKSFDPLCYLYLIRALSVYDAAFGFDNLKSALSMIQSPLHLIGFLGDNMFPINEMQYIKKCMDTLNKICTFKAVDSNYGHDAFLVEIEKYGDYVQFLLDNA